MKGRLAKKICSRTHLTDLVPTVNQLAPYSIEQICTALSMRNKYFIRKHKKGGACHA